jgi:subtilisin family serine protease
MLTNGSKTTFLLAILAISLFATIIPVTVTSVNNTVTASAVEKLAKSLIEEAAKASASAVNVIVETLESTPVANAIAALGGEVSIMYDSAEVLAASLPANELMDLASNPNVLHVYKDQMMYLRLAEGAITEEHMRTNIPLDPLIGTPVFETGTLEIQTESIPVADIESLNPSLYHNPTLTHAEDVWGETYAGAGTTVAIIDTGVWAASPALDGNVIGGIDLSPDVGTPYEGWDRPDNHYHGTACAHLLAAHVYYIFPDTHSWAQGIMAHDPAGTFPVDGTIWVLSLGIAPAASIYGIKVFPHDGSGVPSSIVMDGIDHAIQVGVDVISMSLGGLVGADGEDPSDLLVDAATEAGITVVAAAGNEGPAPLRVGSPGSANTAIAVGAAMDPIHERVFGEIAVGPGYGIYYYPKDEKSIVYFSSRGPSADGRIKPEVVATGSWCWLGVHGDGYIRLGGGTSYSCPQVAGAAALLTTYIREEMLPYGPAEIKQAIYDGADPIPDFTAMEQGAGYLNVANSLDVIISGSFGTIPETFPHHFGPFWFSPIDTLCLEDGKITLHDLTLEPLHYLYFAFWVNGEVDSIKVTLSGVQQAPWPDQNPVFWDGAWIYLSSSVRGGVDDYLFGTSPYLYFWSDMTVAVFKDLDFQPGVVRLVLECDISSYEAMFIEELTIEVTEVWTLGVDKKVIMYNNGVPVDAQIAVYPGKIYKYYGAVEEGEMDIYNFNIPDATGMAYVTLSWCRNWARWATSDLDLIIINPDSTINWDAVTGASPEVTAMIGPGEYTLLVDGYQVYFNKKEYYCLEIVYLADTTPLWESSIFNLECFECISSPEVGIAAAWLHDATFDHWYIAGFTTLKERPCGGRWFR